MMNSGTSFDLYWPTLLFLPGGGYCRHLLPAALGWLVHTHLIGLLSWNLLHHVPTVLGGDWLATGSCHVVTNLTRNLIFNIIAYFLWNRTTDLVVYFVANIFFNNL